MPIKFVTLSETYADKVRVHGFEAETIRIEQYVPNPDKHTYYVSPANSLVFMDGGIDMALSRTVFPDIEPKVKATVKQLQIVNIVGQPYLPIGSSVIFDESQNKSLIVAPTMLLPQNVASTQNAYYATMAILHNILVNRRENLADVDIIFTSFCCGYGKMNEDESIRQILRGIADYSNYQPRILNKYVILHEPNLTDQPKYYQNSQWFDINPADVVQC